MRLQFKRSVELNVLLQMHTTLHLVFKILKWPVALIGLPGMAVACWHRLSASFSGAYLPFSVGVGGMAFMTAFAMAMCRFVCRF